MLGALAFGIATGLGPSLAGLGRGAVAAATVIYIVVIGFRLILAMAAQDAAAVMRSPATSSQRDP